MMQPAAGGMVPQPMAPQMWSQGQAAAADGQMPDQTAQSGDEVRTLWIGDLQYWMDEKYLGCCFSTTEEVSNVKVMRNKQTMESEGYGFIEFYTHAAAERVLQTYNGAIMPNGRGESFRLNWASAGEKRGADDSPDCTIFVGDLASDYTQQEGCYPSVKRLMTISSSSSSKKRLTMCSSSSSKKRLTMSRLPDEIMYLIMCKLLVFPIYLARFSTVCKRWHRLVYSLVQEHHRSTPPPLVFVPLVGGQKKKWEYSYRIDNLMGKYGHAPPVHSLPCESVARVIGSSFGWLIISSDDSNNRSVSLFNPLSKSHIPLPFLEFHIYGLCKGVLSKPPPPRPEEEDQSFDIAITMDHGYWRGYKGCVKIAFLHVENFGGEELQSKQWVYHNHFVDKILDVSRIGARICILHMSGIISWYNHTTGSFSFVQKAHGPWSSIIDAGDNDYDSDDSRYVTAHLLESSSSSKLLVVFRHQDLEATCCCRRTFGFKIFTLTTSSSIDDKEELIWKWTEEDNNRRLLGNDAIFLSNDNGDSVCIQAASNVAAAASIYFTNKFYTQRCRNGNDIGVFNVAQNCITHFIHHVDVDQFLREPPIWLLSSYDKMLKISNIS